MGDDEIELGDDEEEQQAVIVDLVPPDVQEKIRSYVAHYDLPEEAAELLRRAPPFIALRVMTAMTWERIHDTDARMRILRSQVRYVGYASVDQELHEKITKFVKRYHLADDVEYAIRGLTKEQALEVIEPKNPRHSLEGVDPHGCMKIVFTRCKWARKGEHGTSTLKWSMCRQFQQTGSCRYGDTCKWAHSEKQLGRRCDDASEPARSRRRTGEPERRKDPTDGGQYTREEFFSCYGGYGEWDAAEPPAAKATATPRRAAPAEPMPSGIVKGQSYVVQGLSAANSFLNGLVGEVLRAQQGRVIVDLPAHGEKALRASNLTAADQVYGAVD